MEIRHLELLRELSERGSLAAVARATHRTPAALSQQLRTAERELGVKLVEPVSRGIRLTSAGQLLADGATEILHSLASLRAELDTATGEPRGKVTVQALPSAGAPLLPDLVRRLAGSPLIVQLSDFLSMERFATFARDADIVIGHHTTPRPAPQTAEGLITTVLAHEPLDIALSTRHPLADQDELHPSQLIGLPWVGVPEGYPFDAVPAAVEQATGEPAHRVCRLRDNHLVEALVARDVGVGVLPRFASRPGPGIALRPLVGAPAERTIIALSRPERHARQAVRTVLDELREIGQTLTAEA
ncbi:LysR family transcriptional regulator [Nesterenkonia sp. HG001]|uniref:LysR family transcriptional regulator n=1 Tax=Nesterenkonia sp. HG001 TaxID=2983207 RepID=UPI002AC6039E|nr:LysR family transcriptional regulator [Nesterenkonia sp. HG001]MDZ5078602.1 LysR family transcriptional regulator [Nesterenkonia sp. HG001]